MCYQNRKNFRVGLPPLRLGRSKWTWPRRSLRHESGFRQRVCRLFRRASSRPASARLGRPDALDLDPRAEHPDDLSAQLESLVRRSWRRAIALRRSTSRCLLQPSTAPPVVSAWKSTVCPLLVRRPAPAVPATGRACISLTRASGKSCNWWRRNSQQGDRRCARHQSLDRGDGFAPHLRQVRRGRAGRYDRPCHWGRAVGRNAGAPDRWRRASGAMRYLPYSRSSNEPPDGCQPMGVPPRQRRSPAPRSSLVWPRPEETQTKDLSPRLTTCIWALFRSLARSSAERKRLHFLTQSRWHSKPLLSCADSEGWGTSRPEQAALPA